MIEVPTDPVGITDTVDFIDNDAVTLVDAVGITDTATRVRAALRTFTDAVGITDTVVRSKTIEPGSVDGSSTPVGPASVLVGPVTETVVEPSGVDGSSTPTGPLQVYSVGSDNYRPW